MAKTEKRVSASSGRSSQSRTSFRRTDSRDHLLDVALEQYHNILMVHRTSADKKTVIPFDMQEQRIYAYPYKDLRDDMNARSRAILIEQYERAQTDGKIVVFVRDNVKEKLVSFSLDNH